MAPDFVSGGLVSAPEVRVCAFRTVHLGARCRLSSIGTNLTETTLEADSHADTNVLGRGALEIYDYECPVNVQGYDPSLGTRQYRTISGVVAYTHPYSGTKYHLVIHQAVNVPELEHHLLCPMQCRAHGVETSETARYIRTLS